MCYDVTSLTEARLKYARHRSEDPEFIAELERKLSLLRDHTSSYYHVNGFSHPKLLVFTNKQPYEPQLFNWGLIPAWCKSKDDALKHWNHTLNARAETLFDKPSFRVAARKQRCLIMVDAFFEHHHIQGKTFPYCIRSSRGHPLTLAGIWEEWTDQETGELMQTTTIITTTGNSLLSKIHNNPKADGPRMPVILPVEKQNIWLLSNDEQELRDLLRPSPSSDLTAYPVRRLRGRDYPGNTPEVLHEFHYDELP